MNKYNDIYFVNPFNNFKNISPTNGIKRTKIKYITIMNKPDFCISFSFDCKIFMKRNFFLLKKYRLVLRGGCKKGKTTYIMMKTSKVGVLISN